MCISLKMHGSKVMTINTFHGDPRPSLWTLSEPEDPSHIEREDDRSPDSENEQLT